MTNHPFGKILILQSLSFLIPDILLVLINVVHIIKLLWISDIKFCVFLYRCRFPLRSISRPLAMRCLLASSSVRLTSCAGIGSRSLAAAFFIRLFVGLVLSICPGCLVFVGVFVCARLVTAIPGLLSGSW